MKFLSLFDRFRHNQSGHFAAMTALLFIPLLGFTGAALDYSQVSLSRMNLERIADTAVIAAVSKARNEASGKSDYQLINDMKLTAGNMFEAGVAKEVGAGDLQFNTDARIENGIMYAEITYTYAYDTVFLKAVKVNNLNTSGIAEAKSSIGTYSDFNILVDVTSSMGIGADQKDIDYMLGVSNCAFACHSNINSWRANHPVRVRIDVAKDAMQTALDTIEEEKHPDSVIRIGFYTFWENTTAEHIDADEDNQSDDFDWVASKFETHTQLKSGHSLIERRIVDFADKLPLSGIGQTESDPKQYALIITDGSTFDWHTLPDYEPGDPRYNWGSGGATIVRADACDSLKDKGITVFILYTTYYPSYPGHGASLMSKYISEAIHEKNLETLESCATSEDHFYEASNSAQLVSAMHDIFYEIAVPNHLSR